MDSETIRILAPDEARAKGLLALLDGVDGEAFSENGNHGVRVRLDRESATDLIQIFKAVGIWLGDGDHASCEVHFADRFVTLVAPRDGKPADATQFLLERSIQLQKALESRVLLEQAKGILAERLGVDLEAAFEILRTAARSNGHNLHELAVEVVSSPSMPPMLAASLRWQTGGLGTQRPGE